MKNQKQMSSIIQIVSTLISRTFWDVTQRRLAQQPLEIWI